MQTPLDFTRDSHTQHKQQPENMARAFPFTLKAKHKTLHVKRVWAELENSAEKHSTLASIDQDLQKVNSNFLQLLDSNFTINIL